MSGAAGVERPCPVCGAPVGHPCFTVTAGPTVHVVSTHWQRLEVAPWAGMPCLAPGCTRPAAGEVRTLEGSPSPACEVHALELALRCSWCGADPGAPCVTRAAHPVTGRAFLLEVAPHPERSRCSWCGAGADAVDCGTPAHARMLEVQS